MKNRVHIRLRDLSIRTKFTLMISSVILIIGAAAVSGFYFVSRQSQKILYDQTAKAIETINSGITKRMEVLEECSLYIATAPMTQEALRTEKEIGALLSQQQLDILRIMVQFWQNDIVSTTVYTNGGRSVTWNPYFNMQNTQMLDIAKDKMDNAKGHHVWMPPEEYDGSLICVRQILSTATEDFLQPLGYLVTRADFNGIVRDCAGEMLLPEQYNISIICDGELVYPEKDTAQEILEFNRNGGLYEIRSTSEGVRFITGSAFRRGRQDWKIIVDIPYDEMFHAFRKVQALFAAGMILAVLAAAAISYLMQRQLRRQFRLLQTKMERVSQGNLKVYPEEAQEPGGDELCRLNREFDKMTADFKKIIDDNYVKELLLSQTRLKALEQQINPHFLYNSLEAIRWSARRGDGETAARMTQALGRLMRFTLSGEESCIPLEKEFEITEMYLEIQKVRFPETLNVSIEAPEEAKAVLVPKMSLQPLVENAIVHSLQENVTECNIVIRVNLHDGMIRAEVENDGSCFEPDILEKLRRREVKTKGNGIGLMNIDSRIKVLFGEQYGLHTEEHRDSAVIYYEIPATLERPEQEN